MSTESSRWNVESVTTWVEVVSALLIIVGGAVVAGLGVALIIAGVLGMVFSVRAAANVRGDES